MTIQRTENHSHTNHNYDQLSALSWIAPRWRRDIALMPPAKQRETIDRAQQLAASRPSSYLARHLDKLYRVGPGDATPADDEEW